MTILRIGVKNIPILHRFQGNPLALSVYGVSPHAHQVLERLHEVIFGYGFQKVDYLGDFVYLNDTFSKVLISTRVKIALDKYEIAFLLIWFRLGRLCLQGILVINPL